MCSVGEALVKKGSTKCTTQGPNALHKRKHKCTIVLREVFSLVPNAASLLEGLCDDVFHWSGEDVTFGRIED